LNIGCPVDASIELESRASFILWYVIIRDILRDLVPTLSDVEVMEYVSDDRLLTIPLSQVGLELRSLPVLEVDVWNDQIALAIAYRDANSLKHLKNILHPSQIKARDEVINAMKCLPSAFETRLSKRGFKEVGYSIEKKYLTSKVDAGMLSLLINEAETIRAGGRRTVDGRSVYEAPASPVLYLLFRQVKKGEAEFRDALVGMKTVISLISGVKTQREIIHSRLTKPVEQASNYRVFIELVNKARSLYVISAEERRSLEKRLREVPEERGPIEEDLKRRVGPT
jgi:hypothetical protein